MNEKKKTDQIYQINKQIKLQVYKWAKIFCLINNNTWPKYKNVKKQQHCYSNP